MNDKIGEFIVPWIQIWVNDYNSASEGKNNHILWGARNWAVIPRVGDYITINYRYDRFSNPEPVNCLIEKLIWDESDGAIGSPVQQNIKLFTTWPKGYETPIL